MSDYEGNVPDWINKAARWVKEKIIQPIKRIFSPNKKSNLSDNYMLYKEHQKKGITNAILRVKPMDIDGAELSPEREDIELRHVDFSYDSKPILHDVSLTIPEKTTVAIVGPSGSGKTTLCNLMARFWDVQGGSVRLGGRDVREYTYDSLIRNFSFVFQRTYLFSDTIANNIRFGKPNATLEEIKAAAKKARCYDFIMALPDGFDTVIGEGGATLSDGERQRISIARAIMKDAPIIILDEATASFFYTQLCA